MTTIIEPRPVRFLSRKDLHERGISFSKSQLGRLIKDGHFPAPIHLGIKKIAWEENAVNAWALQRMAASAAGDAR